MWGYRRMCLNQWNMFIMDNGRRSNSKGYPKEYPLRVGHENQYPWVSKIELLYFRYQERIFILLGEY
jgi:hypothetical protein